MRNCLVYKERIRLLAEQVLLKRTIAICLKRGFLWALSAVLFQLRECY